MKPYFIKSTLLFCLLLGSIFSNAQPGFIDTTFLNPAQPNSSDSIVVICKLNSYTTPCGVDSFSVSIIDSTITVDAYYYNGFGAAGCITKDTIALGQLLPKHYTLKYNAIDNYAPFKSVSDTIYFTVNQATGINERNNPIQSVSVYPNPSKEGINLKVQLVKAVNATIRLTDVQGKLVHTEQVLLNKGETLHTIATKKLSSGAYTLGVWDNEYLLKEEKIVVQH